MLVSDNLSFNEFAEKCQVMKVKKTALRPSGPASLVLMDVESGRPEPSSARQIAKFLEGTMAPLGEMTL